MQHGWCGWQQRQYVECTHCSKAVSVFLGSLCLLFNVCSVLDHLRCSLFTAAPRVTALRASLQAALMVLLMSLCHLLQVESQLSEQAARLAELKAVEDAYLPVWLSRHVDTSVKYASESWQQVQESEYTAQVVSTVKPHWEWLKQATAPAQVSSAAVSVDDARWCLSGNVDGGNACAACCPVQRHYVSACSVCRACIMHCCLPSCPQCLLRMPFPTASM